MSLTPPEFTLARVCFILSALVVLARLTWWISVEQHVSKIILIFSISAVFLMIGIVLSTGMHWINSRELIVKQPSVSRKEPSTETVSVTPSIYTVNPGRMDEEFVIKVTNDSDYLLWKIQVKIIRESGDMPLEDILISADGSPKTLNQFNIVPDGGIEIGPPKEDKIRITLYGDINGPRLSELYVIKKSGDAYKIFFVDNMDAHSTKSFPLIMYKRRCKTKTKFSFSVSGAYKNPIPTYKQFESGESTTVIPPEGFHDKDEGQ